MKLKSERKQGSTLTMLTCTFTALPRDAIMLTENVFYTLSCSARTAVKLFIPECTVRRRQKRVLTEVHRGKHKHRIPPPPGRRVTLQTAILTASSACLL